MSLHRARMAVLSPTPTWPLDHGNRKRIHAVCRYLQDQGCLVDFIFYPAEHDWRETLPANALAEMRRQWNDVHVLPVSRPLHTAAYPGPDHTIDEWWDPGIGTFLSWLFQRKQYDGFIVNYTWLSRALEFAPDNTLKILDTHDRFAGRREMLAQNGIAAEFFHLSEEEEAIGLNRADVVVAIKEAEADIFVQQCQARLVTVPHYEPPLASELPCRANKAKRVTTFGSIGARNNINITNLRAFLDVALPLFREYMPPLRLIIAGTQSLELEGIESLPYLENMGPVEDIGEFYRAIDVAIAPMAFSTGLKIKVGEALAWRKPLIAHQHAFEGYAAEHPYHECVDFTAMAMAMIRLAFESTDIPPLAEASQRSHEQAQTAFEAGMDTLVTLATRKRPSLLIPIPTAAANTSSLLYESIISTIGYCRYASRLHFMLPQGHGPDSPLANTMAGWGEIHAHGDLAVLAEQIDQSSNLFAIMLWHEPAFTRPLRLPGTQIWLRGDMCRLLAQLNDNEPDAERLDAFANGSLVVVLDNDGCAAAALAERLHLAQAESIPTFYNHDATGNPERHGALILLDDYSESQLLALTQLACGHLPEGESLVVLARLPRPAKLNSSGLRWLRLEDALHQKRRLDGPYRFIINMSQHQGAFSAVTEYLRRQGSGPEIIPVPILSPLMSDWNLPRTYAELSRSIEQAIAHPPRPLTEFDSDLGWTRIWQHINAKQNHIG